MAKIILQRMGNKTDNRGPNLEI